MASPLGPERLVITSALIDESLAARRLLPPPKSAQHSFLRRCLPVGIYFLRRVTHHPVEPQEAGTGRWFIPLIHVRPAYERLISARAAESGNGCTGPLIWEMVASAGRFAVDIILVRLL